eukprot:3023766-Amphidinium_carterae.1
MSANESHTADLQRVHQERDCMTEEYQRVLQTLQYTRSEQHELQGALDARDNEIAILRSQLQQQHQLYEQQQYQQQCGATAVGAS